MVSGKSEGWLRWHRWQAVPIWLSTFQASSGPMCPMTSSQKLTPKPWLISDPKVWQMQPVISSLCRRQIWYPWLCHQRLWCDSEDRDITIKAKNNSRLKSQITFSERLRTLLTNSALLISSSSVRISSYEPDEDDEQLLSSEEMISHVLDDLGNGDIDVYRSGLS